MNCYQLRVLPRLVIFSLLVVTFLLPFVCRAEKQFNYLYIESSEGNSSGGHTAIQFDQEIYHYQFVEPGIIRLEKQNVVDFEFAYRFLGNRTIHLSPVSVTEENFSLIRNYFNFQYLAQRQQFTLQKGLQKDRILLRHLLKKTANETNISLLHVDGAGLFYSSQDFEGLDLASFIKPKSETLRDKVKIIKQLRASINDTYGEHYLSGRKVELIEQISKLQPIVQESMNPDNLTLSRDRFPPASYSFAEQYTDLLTGLMALDVLDNARPLVAGAYIQPDQQVFRLSTVEIETLSQFRTQLRQGLVQLLGSSRPDWGYAVLVNTARLITVDQSIKQGHMVFVDIFRQNSELINGQIIQEFSDEIKVHSELALNAYSQVRETLENAEGFNEFKYSRLELLGNRYVEFNNGLVQKKVIRFNGEDLVPTKSIPVPDLVFPDLSETVLQRSLDSVNAYDTRMNEELKRLYTYNLFTRNCVTELFKTMERALLENSPKRAEKDSVLARVESEKHLGGYVQTVPVNFIPFTSFNSVQNNYNVGQSQELLSFRLLNLQKLYGKENDLLVFFRESNTLSSTLYKRNPDDSFFVFFTDNNILLRPVFGIFNILAATGQSIVGIAAAPFDSGYMLKTGSTGVVMSLPELAFFNMRKGSYKYLSFDWQMNAQDTMKDR